MHNEMQDTDAINDEIAAQEKQVAKFDTAIRSLSATMDAMDGTEPAYERKYRDLQDRQDKLYEKIDEAERKLDEAQRRLDGARDGEATVEEVKLFLTEFGKAIGKVDKATRKTLYTELIDTIEIAAGCRLEVRRGNRQQDSLQAADDIRRQEDAGSEPPRGRNVEASGQGS